MAKRYYGVLITLFNVNNYSYLLENILKRKVHYLLIKKSVIYVPKLIYYTQNSVNYIKQVENVFD